MSYFMFDDLGEEHQKAFNDIMTRAATDQEFRDSLINDPAEAIKSATGIAVPESFEVRFVENDGADLTLVLPDLQEELTDEDLEDVAGGASCVYSDSRICAQGDVPITIDDASIKCVVDIF